MKRCPVCKSHNISLYMGGYFGTYQCKNCNYVGPIILEKVKKSGKSKQK